MSHPNSKPRMYEVRQRVVQILVYHVEAHDKAEAIAIVTTGQACEEYELSGHGGGSISARLLPKHGGSR